MDVVDFALHEAADLSAEWSQGHRLDDVMGASDAGAALWWCGATHKVGLLREVPIRTAAAMTLSAARGEDESVQLVIYPDRAIAEVDVSLLPLRNDRGDVISPSAWTVEAVGYVPVSFRPFTWLAEATPMPDPLIP